MFSAVAPQPLALDITVVPLIGPGDSGTQSASVGTDNRPVSPTLVKPISGFCGASVELREMVELIAKVSITFLCLFCFLKIGSEIFRISLCQYYKRSTINDFATGAVEKKMRLKFANSHVATLLARIFERAV